MSDAMKSLSLKDASTFYKMPCARDSLMLGIGAGFGVGGVRGVLGGMFSSFFLYLLITLAAALPSYILIPRQRNETNGFVSYRTPINVDSV